MLLMIGSVAAYGQTYDSGDKELDTQLKTINTEAKKDLEQFKTDVSKKYSTTIDKIEALINLGMQAADIIMAHEVSAIVLRPVDDVVACYEKNKGKGWGVIAKEMGIKPGSAEFHQLKGNCKNKSNNGKSKGKGKKS
ncbi:MAG: hypothetical protein A3E30_16915 [Fluviicola sp. RIFCSPHIGHO2_12_FULL_43_24]|nr:MAG: hypothetical protein CHH17_03730 [Candidatus Fluviicola riflensis]OGS89019.1 MAG: hypothetical protein A3E30_16915 [Fluviicola sp. RIFCSPHIGHO2_12_FULL_43_24]